MVPTRAGSAWEALSKSHATADTSSRALSRRDIALVSRHWGLYNGAATVGACSHL